MTDFKSIVIERDINPYHAFLSSYFAGFAELGMINQGSINIVSRRAAEYLYSYLEAREWISKLKRFEDITSPECIRYHVDCVNGMLNIMGNYEVVGTAEGEISLHVAGDMCRICPKGVGGAEISGSFCPIPTFIERMVNLMLGQDVLALQGKGICKEGLTCVTTYRVMG